MARSTRKVSCVKTARTRANEQEIDTQAPQPAPREPRLVYLFIVDEAGSCDFLELVQNAISAAAHGLPDDAYIGALSSLASVPLRDRPADPSLCAFHPGFVTFSNRIGAFDFGHAPPMFKHCTIDKTLFAVSLSLPSNQHGKQTRCSIAELMNTVEDFVVPLGPNRQRVADVIESLDGHPSGTDQRYAMRM